MRAILMDVYRSNDKLVLWLKNEEDIRLELDYSVNIYLEKNSLSDDFVLLNNLHLKKVKKKNYLGEMIDVYVMKIDRLSRFEKIVRWIELQTKHRLNLYNADVSPEQIFLFENEIAPFDLVEIQDGVIKKISSEYHAETKSVAIEINGFEKISSIKMDLKTYTGSEKRILSNFSKDFNLLDPDILIVKSAFSKIPFLYERLKANSLHCKLHRWDFSPLHSKGGKSFFTYGRVIYREYAVRLNGRFLVDSTSTIGEECEVEAIMEISQLCSARFQQVASRSFGAAFQTALVRELVRRKLLVPFKEKPVDHPISMKDLLKFDRVGHRFDSLTGVHFNVAEIDFSSLFPWIIYNYNISPESFKEDSTCTQIPGLPIKISFSKKGLIPSAIKPILDRRMYYKKNPSAVNKSRIQGLKWILVTSYGYLRFREFKLGLSTSHMAIGFFARSMLIRAKEICEERGFKIIHGIVDSLYIQKDSFNQKDITSICSDLEAEMGVPVSFEGIFKWITFLPSVNDISRPVPSKYYGLYNDGTFKVRGLELRQAGMAFIVSSFQNMALESMKRDFLSSFDCNVNLLKKIIINLKKYSAHDLSFSLTISKTDYKQDNVQSQIIKKLISKGYSLKPGYHISYVYSSTGACLPEDYDGKPDVDKYKQILVRSLYSLYSAHGRTKDEINERLENEKQMKLNQFFREEVVV